MQTFLSIILAILALMIMIVLHEWGHFIAGRICKTPIAEFSVGMGPLIFQKQGKKETKYSLRAVPLGGYCAFDTDDSTGVVDSSLNKLPVYKRIFIFIAGPFMNIITAILVYFFIALALGFPAVTPIVDTVVEDGPSYNIIQEGDEILAINNKEINGNSTIMAQYLNESNGKDVVVTVLRDGNKMDLVITPKYNEANQKYMIGITQLAKNERLGFIDSVKYAKSATIEAVVATYQGLWGLITGKHKVSEMSGVVGIVSVVSTYAKPSSFNIFLSLCGLISINLGIMNLLPIPGLDGSKILFGLYEKIFRKPIPEKTEYYMTMVGFCLLIGLFILVTISDIIKLF